MIFGDQAGFVHGLDINTGAERWRIRPNPHSGAAIFGSPTMVEDYVAIGISSIEELFAGFPGYACCTFRGSVVLLNPADGHVLWQTFLVDQPHENPDGSFGPSGSAVWSTPTYDPLVIAECLARPVLAERLLTESYAHDERFHGELKGRAEAELRTHRSVKQMKQTSGMYTQMEWIKSDDAYAVEAGVPPAQPTRLPPQKEADAKSVQAVRMTTSEWQESVQKLAAQFDSQDIVGQAPRLPNGRSAAGAATPQKPALAQIKTGVLSALQEDDGHYYAVAVMKKGKDRLTLATVAWLKEPLPSWLAKAERQVPVTMAAVSANYALPVIASPSGGCTDDTWTPTSLTNVPAGRAFHSAVWTGSEMIVWGGTDNTSFLNTGGRYNPSTDSWTATSTTNAPAARNLHTAVWTGSEMIVWGGDNLNTGGRYNPSTNTWTPTTTTNAPTGRAYHSAVWIGSQMIVWGGFGSSGFLNTGGRYNPGTDSWTATSLTNAPTARALHTAVWTGSEIFVWGGEGPSGYVNTGGRYNPGSDSWTATSAPDAPTARAGHTSVWTGSEMIVWGGVGSSGFLNTGGSYNPSINSWTATSTTNVPAARVNHTAVWTGSEMIVWGGYNGSYLNSGGRFNPGTDSWTATSTTGAPAARQHHTAVWTGSEMIVWGGTDATSYFNTGGRYCAQPPPCTDDTWTGTSVTGAPAGRFEHSVVWTGSEMIVWGGYNGSILNTGGRYNPSTDSWTATSTTNAPAARDAHTAVWTGSEMIVWGGFNGSSYLNTGGRYNPSTDSWTTTSTTNAPAGRAQHTAVWTGSEMIVWSGSNASYLTTGGRYNPSADSWTATSTTNAPSGRVYHTAVWTGSEMIVWGGYHLGNGLNSGGRYNPNLDTWTATSTVNTPSGRYDHTAIWRDSEMIIWGGYNGSNVFNTGGRYNPGIDSWTVTSTTGAPEGREAHTAVWTGSQMIVWGGDNVSGSNLNTGGRYNPSTDSWTATSTTGAPAGRILHTAVWTGSQMIVWGGFDGSSLFNTGGRYCAVVATPTPSPTPTATPTATATPTPTPTPTPCAGRCAPTPRPHPTRAPRPTPTATPCTITFSDVPPESPFYYFIRCLVCQGIASGYADGTFRPYNDITRAQICKWVSLAAGFNDPIPDTTWTFHDVPPHSAFWLFIERLAARGIVSGYACGGPGEPCDPENRPYFRPYNSITRGQISKVVALAAGFHDPVPYGTQTFQDVDPFNPFWLFIERLALRDIVSGYACGGPGEPCIPPENRPYFRPYNYATRGQAAKIVSLTFFPPSCWAP